MKSIAQMLVQLDGLFDTKELTDEESVFVVRALKQHLEKHELSEKDVAIVQELYKRHFA